MIHSLKHDDKWLKYPAFYNAYPIRNEVSHAAQAAPRQEPPFGDFYCDDYYGRLFDLESREFGPKYGATSRLSHYVGIRSLPIVEELRVPYRRIPIFRTDDPAAISQCIVELSERNRDHQVLLRGQTKTYTIDRPPCESEFFYGDENVKEPSFLPSHLRKSYDACFLKGMWQSQAAILLNDVAYDIGQANGESAMAEFRNRVYSFRSSPLYLPFALGIAQHYGLPSVGLDLTDRLEVAIWFSTHSIAIAASGEAKTAVIDFGSNLSPTVFLFRCPRDAVFDYKPSRVDGLPTGRPDHQGAWFGHVGWGAASNQLGSYLMCGFRVGADVVNRLPQNLHCQLFPKPEDDPILEFFLEMRRAGRYEGEAKRALQGIYNVTD